MSGTIFCLKTNFLRTSCKFCGIIAGMIEGKFLNVISVFIGGGLGAVGRYGLGLLAVRLLGSANFPYATLGINILGSFLLGVFFVLFTQRPEMSGAVKLALTVGFCGGFTTFSTFSLEVYEMIARGHLGQSLGYILLSLTIGIIAVWAGGYCAKLI